MADLNVPREDQVVGISKYATPEPGFSGSFKEEPEDFTVEEISEDYVTDVKGKYTIVKVRLRNWDTNKFVLKLARELGIFSDRITYAGTKDKFAVTVQNFCINSEFSELPPIQDVEYLDTYRSAKMLRLGSLKGNRFTVRLRGTDLSETGAAGIMEKIRLTGGFPNYYGLQRFGSMRPVTHLVGKFLLKGDFEGAVREYICDPEIDRDEFRLNYLNSGDAEQALKDFPRNLVFERALLSRLAAGDSYERAIRSFPRNLNMLFVHAYQSYIFNIALSRRMSMVSDLKEILPGDQVAPVDEFFNTEKGKVVQCDRFNLEKLNRLSSESKVRAVIKLPGFETRLTDSAMDSAVSEILEEEGIKKEDFRVGGNKALSSKGSFRIVSAMPLEFAMEPPDTVKFSLGRGIYATVFLREILKGQALA